MWQQNYLPVGGSLALSTLAASVPLLVLLFLIGVMRKPAYVAALSGLAAAILVAVGVYGMPVPLVGSTILYGAAFGMWPIGWIVYSAIVLYQVMLQTGKFEVIKDSIGGLTTDRRLQALFIAFAFGAFVEGAAGFGTPVAVAAGMMTGLGFSPFYAAGICLLANTAPVAFGSIGVPVTTLAGITGLPEMELSQWVGRICAPISVFVPAYLITVMAGKRGLMGVIPGVAVCGILFASTQFYVSNFVGPQLTDILAALAAIVGLVVLMKLWKPSDEFAFVGEGKASALTTGPAKQHSGGDTFMAWMPYLLLVVFVLAWGSTPVKALLNKWGTWVIPWPGLHNVVQQMPPVTKAASPYAANFTFNSLSAAGTSCILAAFLASLLLGMSPGKFVSIFFGVGKQMSKALLTIASVLGLAYLMNYCGATSTLGLAFASTGALFPFFSALLGWLGVFLTGSDTSANALFGNLQVVTANSLGFSPALMAAANSAGGVMGKMISVQSIAVAAAATGMKSEDESRLFRFTLKHSIFLASVLGLISMFYAHGVVGRGESRTVQPKDFVIKE
jgi:L-lactate transport